MFARNGKTQQIANIHAHGRVRAAQVGKFNKLIAGSAVITKAYGDMFYFLKYHLSILCEIQVK